MHSSRGFTLIELLVVIAIIAILSVVVILVLNPAELLRQSRDSNRLSDLASLTTALGIYGAQGGSTLGSINTVYVSLIDPLATSTVGDQCQGLGLPLLPGTYSYHCSASSTYRNVNGQGWVPINLVSLSGGSPLGQLPIDPINVSSSRNYYTYTTNGTQYEVTSPMESQKYKPGGSNDVISTDGGSLASVYEKGTKLGLEPLDYGDSSLVGYWPLNEGTSSIAYDDSGNNATGTWHGTQAGTSGYYSAGTIGSWAGNFDGSTNYISTANSTSLQPTNAITVVAYIYLPLVPAALNSAGLNFCYGVAGEQYGGYSAPYTVYGLRMDCGNGLWYPNFVVGHADTTSDGINASVSVASSSLVNTWTQVAGVYSASPGIFAFYINGVSKYSSTGSGKAITTSNNSITIGGGSTAIQDMNGLIDDIRIYNRALSATEIAALYNGGK